MKFAHKMSLSLRYVELFEITYVFPPLFSSGLLRDDLPAWRWGPTPGEPAHNQEGVSVPRRFRVPGEIFS